jgi:general secretion pathway protein G
MKKKGRDLLARPNPPAGGEGGIRQPVENGLALSEPPAGGESNGFTFIELLVTITIIGVLAAVSMISYTSITMRSRDTKRKQDLRVIQQAFEQYYANKASKYPTSIEDEELTTYLPAGIPMDPKGCSYTVVPPLTITAYKICADLETVDSGSCTVAQDYCVSQLQR